MSSSKSNNINWDAKTKCKKCGNFTSINKYELCKPCRTKTCVKCGLTYAATTTLHLDRCSKCARGRMPRTKKIDQEWLAF